MSQDILVILSWIVAFIVWVLIMRYYGGYSWDDLIFDGSEKFFRWVDKFFRWVDKYTDGREPE